VLVVPSTLGTISYTRTAMSYLGNEVEVRAILLTPAFGKNIEAINRDHLKSFYPDTPVRLFPNLDEGSETEPYPSVIEDIGSEVTPV
ncbi:MAG: hypothetical protein ABEJ65_02005, partial [bacterium]